MPARTMAWTLAFTACLLGAATGANALQTAQGVAAPPQGDGATAALAEPTGLPADPGHPLEPQPSVDEAAAAVASGLPVAIGTEVGVSVDADARLDADAHVGASVGAEPGTDPPAARPSSGEPSASARAWDVVPEDPTGRSLFAAALVGALALTVEGFRFLLARLGAPVGRALRAIAALVPALALFSRINRDSLLENPVRARVHDAIAHDPGLSVSEVSSRAGIAWGTTVHHLRRLEAHGMVVSVDQPPHRRFFAANSVAATQRAAVAVILQPTARRIAELVHARPGIDQTGVCQRLGLKNPAASKHLRAFEAKGLIASTREGRNRHYQPTEALGAALAVVAVSSMSVGARPPNMGIPAVAAPSGFRPAMVSRPAGA